MQGDRGPRIGRWRALRRVLGAALIAAGVAVTPAAGRAQMGILQSSYLGGQGRTEGRAVAVNPANGNIFVAGAATLPDIPAGGGFQGDFGGEQDGFVVFFGPLLKTLPRATYVGDSGSEQIDAMVVDTQSGDVLVAGYTTSDSLPGTDGGAQPTRSGPSDAFVARISNDLKTLRQATYLGGSGTESGPMLGLAIDPQSGDVFVAGSTTSTDFPGRNGSARPSCTGSTCVDGFVARLSGDLKSIVRSSYVGEDRDDHAYNVFVHPNTGDVLISGDSVAANSSRLGVVTCYSGDLRTFRGVNRLGTKAWGLDVDPGSGDVIAAGETSSTLTGAADGAQQQFGGGDSDAFVARFNADLVLLQSTFLGGGGTDGGNVSVVLLPDSDELIVAGSTTSTNFPATGGGAQAGPGGGRDGFLARLTSDLSTISQASYLGGSRDDDPYQVILSGNGAEAIVVGATNSPNFPATAGGAQPALPAASVPSPAAVFVSRVAADLIGGPTTPTPTGNATPTPTGGPIACVGDCAGDGAVSVDDLIKGVNIALGNLAVSSCPAFDPSGDGTVSVNELVQAVGNALNGCS